MQEFSTEARTAFETRPFRICDILFALARNISNNQAYEHLYVSATFPGILFVPCKRSRWSANSTLIDYARQFRSR